MSSADFVGSAIIIGYSEGEWGGRELAGRQEGELKGGKKEKWGCYKDRREKLKVLVGQFKLVLIV